MRRYKHAFTLLEIMVALSIFAVLASISALVLQNVLRGYQSTAQHQQRLAELQLATARLKQDFENINDIVWRDQESRYQATLNGSAEQVSFSRVISPNFMHVRYYLSDQTLWREAQAINQQAFINDQIQRQKILTAVKSMRIEYLDHNQVFVPYWRVAINNDNHSEQRANIARAIQIHLQLVDLGELSMLYILPGNRDDHHEA